MRYTRIHSESRAFVTLLAGFAAACADPMTPPDAEHALPSEPAFARGFPPVEPPRPGLKPRVSGTIAFYSDRAGPGQTDTYVMSGGGIRLTNITNDPVSFDWQPALSPSGDQVAFASLVHGDAPPTHDIYVMNANGNGQPWRLTDNGAFNFEPAWSPDGKHIAFMSTLDWNGDADIHVMRASPNPFGLSIRLTDHPAKDSQPAWSPDGERIAFVSNRDGQSDIYVMNVVLNCRSRLHCRELRLTRLTYDGHNGHPAWSPDGEQIAYDHWQDGYYDIYVINTKGNGQPRRLTNNGSSNRTPAWSPNGSQIAFVSFQDGNSEIYVMNADGTGLKNITNNPATDDWPSWSN